MTNPKITAGIQSGLLVLVALMPFHAFLSVWLGSITHHQAIIQAWKEVLLLVLSALGATLILRDDEARGRLRRWAVVLIGAFAALALIVTIATRPSLTAIAFGAKTDLEFFVAFILAIIVASPKFTRHLIWALIIPAGLVIAFGLLQITVLPANFLTHFGYGPTTIVPYQILDPVVRTLRFGSTLGGPNQLGTYLILPLALVGILAFRRRRWWGLVLVAGGIFVMVHTYSRSAWAGAGVAAVTVLLALSPARSRAWLVAGLAGVGLIGVWVADRLVGSSSNWQYYLLHSNALWHDKRGSDFEHLRSLQAGLSASLAAPFGHGLGTAGPATFHAGTTVIIENNYLQVAYETGLAGAALFIAAVIAVALELARAARHNDLAGAALAAIIGISATALVLPAWADSTTALTVWTAAGAAIGLGAAGGSRV